MLKGTAGKSYAGRTPLIFNYFYIVHSDTFAHETGAKSLADSFFGGKPGSITLGFFARIINCLAILYLIFSKALTEK